MVSLNKRKYELNIGKHCKYEGCKSRARSKGFCIMHYQLIARKEGRW